MAYSIETSRDWWLEDNPPAWEPGPDDYAELDEARLQAEIETARHETKVRLWEQLTGYVERCQQMCGEG